LLRFEGARRRMQRFLAARGDHQPDLRMAGPRMADDVGQRFLGDAEEPLNGDPHQVVDGAEQAQIIRSSFHLAAQGIIREILRQQFSI
jgi:hypothetical protein